MIILDTNVLSSIMRQEPDPAVLSWLDRQPRISVWTTSVTVFEIQFGLNILAGGKRRSLLNAAFDQLLGKLGQRVATFDVEAAGHASDLMASRHRKGRP